jgi:hypothetical protein
MARVSNDLPIIGECGAILFGVTSFAAIKWEVTVTVFSCIFFRLAPEMHLLRVALIGRCGNEASRAHGRL